MNEEFDKLFIDSFEEYYPEEEPEEDSFEEEYQEKFKDYPTRRKKAKFKPENVLNKQILSEEELEELLIENE